MKERNTKRKSNKVIETQRNILKELNDYIKRNCYFRKENILKK